MLFTPSGRITLVRFVQPLNHLKIVVTLAGIVIVFRLVQFSNVNTPAAAVIQLPSVTFSSAEHPLNV